MSVPGTAGLLLAAGAGRRMGRPKALVDDWLERSVGVLRDGGCTPLTVVLGAAADQARARVPDGVAVVVAEDWASGMGASLAAGLAALAPTDAVAALVHLVDLPDVGPDVVTRVLAEPHGPDTLRRASYDGEAGHPVLLGRDHWDGVRAAASGDRGARDYLRVRDVEQVECGDLAGGLDVDTRVDTHADSRGDTNQEGTSPT
ncbi:NTP transferase domain-containing protein [Nocardioides sp. CFH 31398]|uniref:nucleotidyltransferase family protein n=1 Tax=Nocardioides sp. CFH 31398 TaxID=2919579 RepID=UPI001F059027|nr:NTP transferase domain-containing protein [Nocardioides sp. CFH 31398]MCH1867693.1 NTP transferase domain-containing protein [Nocardioides sp. CFH 31398]